MIIPYYTLTREVPMYQTIRVTVQLLTCLIACSALSFATNGNGSNSPQQWLVKTTKCAAVGLTTWKLMHPLFKRSNGSSSICGWFSHQTSIYSEFPSHVWWHRRVSENSGEITTLPLGFPHLPLEIADWSLLPSASFGTSMGSMYPWDSEIFE